MAATKPTVAAKPVFTPTHSQRSVASSVYNTSQRPRVGQQQQRVDEDGWGEDAPPVTRTQLEKVESAYKPTRVDMRELTSQGMPLSTSSAAHDRQSERPGVIGGSYQPVGKVDIAEIRRQARESGTLRDERPEPVRGSYEPVGKVDIASIRAKAQKPSDFPTSTSVSRPEEVSDTSEAPRSLADKSAAFSGPERLTSLPKPKVASKFGGSSFTGTKAPMPAGFEAKPVPTAVPVGMASRTFADEGGKTPAQIWAEKKAREHGASGSGDIISPTGHPAQSPIASQRSGDGGWKSSYSGKKWAPVQTTHTGGSGTGSIEEQRTGDIPTGVDEQEEPSSPAGGVGALRDRFSGAPPMGAPASGVARPAPEPDTSSKPNRGIPIPGLPTQRSEDVPQMPTPPPQPRSPTPPTPELRSASPIRVAMPVSRTAVTDVHEEQTSPPPAMPVRSLEEIAPEDEADEPDTGPDPGRAVAQTTAAAAMGETAVQDAAAATPGGTQNERAVAEYDYEAAEDNEVSLREGEIVTNIDRVDPDWWVVTNEHGQSGLVPSNYLKVLEDDSAVGSHSAMASATQAPAHEEVAASSAAGLAATALYDYEAAGKYHHDT